MAEAHPHLDALLQRHADEAGLPSLQAAVALDGDVIWAGSAGLATDASRYVIFSATKAYVAAAAWQLLAEGSITTRTPVRAILPELGIDGPTPDRASRVTIEDLMVHTGGFPSHHLAPSEWTSAAERRARYATWGCETEPGETFAYHAVAGHWVLADVIEAVDGRDFRESVRRRVTDPLGLAPVLGPAACTGDVRAPVAVGAEATAEEWQAVGIPPPPTEPGAPSTHDVVAALGHPDVRGFGVPGGGGVACTGDLARFYQGLLRPDGPWHPEVLGLATTVRHLDLVEPYLHVRVNRSLGLIVAGDDGQAPFRGFGNLQSPRSFGHDGAGGQIAFADPDSGLSYAVLTDGMDLHAIRQWRRGRSIIDALVRTFDPSVEPSPHRRVP